jgi:hypothetical protein
MMLLRTLKLLPILLAVIALSSISPAPGARPEGPIVYSREIRPNPSLRIYTVIIDLTDPHVRVKVAAGDIDPNLYEPWNTTLMTVSEMARREHFTAAINGSPFMPKDTQWILGYKYPYFDGNWTRPVGWLMSDGALLTPNPKYRDWPTLIIVGRNHPEIGRFDALPPGTTQAITGTFDIVREGKTYRLPDADPTDPSILAPRTAVGFDRDRTKLIFLVVDGRRPGYSDGISEYQVGQEMVRLGAWTALILDSGGSSTMAIRAPGGKVNVVNRPSDGHELLIPLSIERGVADCIGVAVDAPAGQAGPDAGN